MAVGICLSHINNSPSCDITIGDTEIVYGTLLQYILSKAMNNVHVC